MSESPHSLERPDIQAVPIDWAAAFNGVAPLVTAAHAYLDSGNTAEAMKCLSRACERINMATRMILWCPKETNA